MFIPKTFATTSPTRADRPGRAAAWGHHRGRPERPLPAPHDGGQAGVGQEGRIGKPFAVRICHHHGTLDVFAQRLVSGSGRRRPGAVARLVWHRPDPPLHGRAPERRTRAIRQLHDPGQPLHGLRPHRASPVGWDGVVRYVLLQPCGLSLLADGDRRATGGISIHRAAEDSNTVVVVVDGPNGYETLPLPEHAPNGRAFGLTTF